ncbi:hypothetical protein JCM17823_06590 [Halorubrum gandharaense]
MGRELDLATGQVQYHLRRLVADEELVVERVGGRSHYFVPSFDPWERRALAFIRRETARAIIFRLHANGPTQQATLASELGLTRSTISWHISTLVDAGIIGKSEDHPMTVSLTHPAATADLLDDVSPSLPDRLVDRFIRTVDSVF